ncbi:MAG: efflux RND transporter periplasmic adaptor subunit, partial [Deltaproteobacteria bacterium]|nr:efflux RND transporter periplasmic adaptor subunit [Kofleriaceae bacterium]
CRAPAAARHARSRDARRRPAPAPRRDRAVGRTGGGRAFQLRSPLAGTLVEIHPASGQSVEAGEALFTVVDLSRVWVHAHVFEPDIARVAGATRATFKVDGHAQPFEIAPPDGAVVTVGNMVDEKTRTVPMIFEVGNADGKLRIGSFASVFIATGAPRAALAVPDGAIVDDAGREVIYVQVGGESFERRVVGTGIHSGGWTEITSGLAAGERVVTRGAYSIKLAAAGGSLPEHGHAH